MKVAITGATGFVGSRLVERLQADNQEIVAWVRHPEKARLKFPAATFPQLTIVPYTPTVSGQWQEMVEGCDAVVNLAGEPIADRWTPQKRQAILDSRALGTRRIVEAINQATTPPRVLVNASAVGYYGTSETATFVEDNPPGNDFLSKVCQEWEAAAQAVTAPGCRVVILRTGIVLALGGAIERMLLPFQLFAGGPIGTGNQWFSWIHRDDLVTIIEASLQQPNLSGVLNATAPKPVKMAEFCATLGDVLSRPSWLPVPGFALEALLGEASQVVLEGQRVLPQRLLASGFEFQYPDLKPALQEFL
ncbi:MAG: TIGR01777 family oxidoreductase [Prochlorotrichaceae cyanobacterium]